MSIYVDSEAPWGGSATFKSPKSCHMASDDYSPEGIEAFHRFAESIGLKRVWYQQHAIMPHYDLFPSKRILAVKRGAIVVRTDQMIERCSIRRLADEHS